MKHVVRRRWFDVAVVVLAVAAMVEVAAGQESPTAPTSLWVTLPALALTASALIVRRRFPFGAPTVYWVGVAVLSFVDGRLIPFADSVFILGMAASFLLGHLREEVQARAGLAVVIGGAAVVIAKSPNHANAELVFIPVLFGICWLAGFAVRDRAVRAEAAEVRADQAERERDAAARIAVAEERARIARELHDVVAHAVSVMVLQVGAVRHRLPDARAEDREALIGVEQAGRNALVEMRRLLAAMRTESDGAERSPFPGLAGLEALASEVGRAGLHVVVHVDGEPFPLPGAVDLSAYRIVQEGLTNALKHAVASAAHVTVRYRPGELMLEVRDDGMGSTSNDGLGHGLVGIRERVKIYGGDMTARSRPEGGFVLSTRLPLGGNGQ